MELHDHAENEPAGPVRSVTVIHQRALGVGGMALLASVLHELWPAVAGAGITGLAIYLTLRGLGASERRTGQAADSEAAGIGI